MLYNKHTQHIHFYPLQRRAVVIILSICLLIIGIRFLYGSFTKPKIYDADKFESILCKLENKANIAQPQTLSKKKKLALRAFDPNTISKKELIDMGVKEKTATTWTNYTSKGGRFNDAEDISKIYGVGEYLTEKMKPFIRIKSKEYKIAANTSSRKNFETSSSDTRNKVTNPKKKEYSKSRFETFHKTNTVVDSAAEKEKIIAYNKEYKDRIKRKTESINTAVKIDINSCDTLDLISLKGIGEKSAKRIIEYRDKLGGFYNEEQILEVYGVNAARMIKFIDRIEFGPLRKININTASIDELKAHPYIDYKAASVLFYYRRNHGPYASAKDLRKTVALKKSWIREVAPYFDFTIPSNENGPE